MSGPVTVRIVDGPLPRADAFAVEGAGAVCCFEGIVRPEEQGQPLVGLDYETYDPMAQRQLQRLAEQTLERFGLLAIEVVHSRGLVCAGRCSLRLRLASKHRKEALAAMDAFIDALKRDVPIWKHARYAEEPAAHHSGKQATC
jgi:molybdopterin synthase catalytic subunit